MSPARIRIALALIALAACLAVQTGNFGSYDTMRRFQVTHWLWQPAPQVAPRDAPDFGQIGRGGKRYAWYGIGQSLLMLPADVAVTSFTPRSVHRSAHFQQWRVLAVALLTFPWLDSLSVLLAFELLMELEFEPPLAALGALTLLFSTSFLHYAQVHQENNQILLCALAAYWGVLRWRRTGRRFALIAGAAALGFSILIRLPDLAIVAAVLLFGAAALRAARRGPGPPLRLHAGWNYWGIMLGFCGLGLAGDRLYQWYRFGSPFTLYTPMPVAYMQRVLHLHLPAGYPFNYPLGWGVYGALFSFNKSIFVFDPLLLLTLGVVLWRWKALDQLPRLYLLSLALMLAATILGYARFADWSGNSAWGDRFTTVPVDLLAMLAVPLLLRYRGARGPREFRWPALALVSAATLMQMISLPLRDNVELVQLATGPFGVFFIPARRVANLIAIACARGPASGPAGAFPHSGLPAINLLPAWLQTMGARGLVAPAWTLWALCAAFALSLAFGLARRACAAALAAAPAELRSSLAAQASSRA